MATTFAVLEVGQGSKEALINTNFAQVPRYLGEAAANPATLDVPAGSTYFNTTTSKLMVLKTNMTWVNAA